MKIILTKNQKLMLEAINNGGNMNTIEGFNKTYSELINKLNKIYTNINFLSIAELINGEVDLGPMIEEVDTLETFSIKLMTSVSNFFNSKDEDDYDRSWSDMHREFERKDWLATDKLNIISSLLMDLSSLVSDNEKNHGTFNDITTTNL